ncbi:MAG: TIGR04086 family membrane protein [Clostridia bacterium]|nr:TIGR04086 family membrane protein [Clostridia bacterium]
MRREADISRYDPGFQLGAVAAGVACAFVLTLLASALMALAVYSTGLADTTAETLIFYGGVLCLAAGAGYGSRRAGSLGWLHGAAVGVVYAALAMAVGLLAFQSDVTVLDLFRRLVLGLIAGIVGGVLGVNL